MKNVEAIYPLTPTQEALLLTPGGAAHAEAAGAQCSFALRGRLDADAFAAGWQRVVDKYQALRSSFLGPNPQKLLRVVLKSLPAAVEWRDLRDLPRARRDEQVEATLRAERARRRAHAQAAPPALTVCLLEEGLQHVALTYHPALLDARSLGVVFGELFTPYGQSRGSAPSEPARERRHQDYLNRVRGREAAAETFWREALGGFSRATTDPGRAPSTGGGDDYLTRRVPWPSSLDAALRALAREQGLGVEDFVRGVWALLLGRYGDTRAVLFGASVEGRPEHPGGAELLVGSYASIAPAPAGIDEEAPALAWLKEFAARFELIRRHSPVTPSQLRAWGDFGDGLPLFESCVRTEPAPLSDGLPEAATHGFEISDVRAVEPQLAPLTLSLAPQPGAQPHITYDAGLFDAGTTELMCGHLLTLLEAVVATPERRVADLPLLTEKERLQLDSWNDTRTEYPRDLCVHRLFEQQAAAAPGAVAIVEAGVELSYGELNERANRIARVLRRRGVRHESRVGLLMERGTEAVVSLLAVLKAGGAYVPLDPEYPQERLRFMLEEAGVGVVVTGGGPGSLLETVEGVDVLNLSGAAEELSSESCEDLECDAGPDSAACVIFTSGSTGRPKGVLLAHRGIVRLVRDTDYISLSAGDCVTQVATLSFDASVFEVWGALLNGARLAVIPKELALSPPDLTAELRRLNVTTALVTTALFNRLAREPEPFKGLREVLFGGEAADPRAVRSLLRGGGGPRRLLNAYGPTENSTISTCELVAEVGEEAKSVPIGRPIANSTAYVLDRRMRPLPAGVSGELYVGGEGLARCYVGRAALSAERFVPDPFSAEPGARLYRTGDVVRQGADGRIEFVGRADSQVKVRGFRIELGEVEFNLSAHPQVKGCVVLVREDEPGDKRLVAYVAAGGAGVSAAELREHMKGRLPGYMVPSAFVLMEELPLNVNGKVDRKALPAPDSSASASSDAYVAPRDAVEGALCEILSEVLKVERVGVEDNFFELGGHSLLATQVVGRVREVLGVEVPLRALFEAPTVAALAAHVEAARARRSEEQPASQPPPLVPVGRDGKLTPSFAQQRLWFIDQLEPGNASYNIPVALRLKGELDAAVLERTLGEITRRHESLRTGFDSEAGLPVPVIAPSLRVELSATEVRGADESERLAEARRLADEEARSPFDLRHAPLWRARLLRLGPQDHVLLVTMHHIISDGWSMGVLVREVGALYAAFSEGRESPLAALPLQYADFAAWQRGWLRGEELERQLSYWKRQLEGAPALLELPTDRPRPTEQSFRGGRLSFTLPAGLSAELRALGRRENATLFMVLLAGFNTLLMRYTRQADVVVGSPVANRTRPEVEGIIGVFVNMLVLRTDLSGDPAFRQLLARTKEVVLAASAHQELPFEKLVEELQPVRDLSRAPLFQVMFILQNAPLPELELPGVTLKPTEVESGRTKFDLTLSLWEAGPTLGGALEYSTDLFDAGTMRRLLAHYQQVLEAAVSDPGRRLSELPLLSPDERRQIVEGWNETRVDYPSGLCLHELVEGQVERSPDAPAVVFEAETLSYRELNERANRLAHHLRTLRVGPDVVVGVLMERSVEMVVSLLAVLKAGGAYLPLDPEYPRERLRFMLEDLRPPVLLTQRRLLEKLPEHDAEVLCLDAKPEAVERQSTENPASGASPDNLAYVIFTSGSTGQPKGAMNTHRAICNRLLWMQDAYRLDDTDRVLQKTPYTFDVSVWEFFWPLLAGARLVVARPGGHQDSSYLVRLVAEQHVTTLHFVPPMLRVFLQEPGLQRCEHLKRVICSGEALPFESQRRFYELLGAELHNLYGPTEAAVDVTFWECERETERRSVPIGRPIANVRIHLLDAHMEPVPVGVAGELHIGGVGLARGYANRPGLTAEKFVPDPLSGEAGARLYKTGDLARYLPGGEIEYLGRMDGQVKIRGFRIELGEIEAALASHEQVAEAAVLARPDATGERRLVAYLVARPGESPAPDGLRSFLRRKLPDYMVPAAYVALERMPLTANGKLDRRALPEPGRPEAGAGYSEPRTPTEEVIAGIWAEVLGLERVGRDDNFFELGGHSLLATQVASRVREVFQVDPPLHSMFKTPTVAALAEYVETATRAAGAEPPALVAAGQHLEEGEL